MDTVSKRSYRSFMQISAHSKSAKHTCYFFITMFHCGHEGSHTIWHLLGYFTIFKNQTTKKKKNLHVGCWQVSFHLAVLHISFLAPYVICNDPLTLRQTHALRVAKYIPQELNSWVHRIKHKGINAYITSSIIINYWINIIKRPLAK